MHGAYSVTHKIKKGTEKEENHTLESICVSNKTMAKQSIYRPAQDLTVAGVWGSQNFYTIVTSMWQSFQAYAPATYCPHEITLVLERLCRSQDHSTAEIITPRIELAPFRCIAQWLNRLCHRVPKQYNSKKISRKKERRQNHRIWNCKENAEEKDRHQDGDNILGKQWCRRKEEHGRKLRNSFEKTRIDGEALF